MRLQSLLLLAPLASLACQAEPDADPVSTLTLSTGHDPLGLTDLAEEAISLAPSWLRDELALNLSQLETLLQDELALLIVDLDEPWLVDEVAFAAAHTSPEVLGDDSFHPELLALNARLVDARDADLEYVTLVDVGEAGEDEDYYTTAAYQVELEDGSLVERTVDREIYYWYVVHPRLEDELPYYLDAWQNSWPTDPESGMPWREFLWDRAADDCTEGRHCPLLVDALAGVDVLWRSALYSREDNGAIGALTGYILDALDFGAGSERPNQPSRIYVLGNGNCGEHSDLTCAAARAALIPCQNVGAFANDHTWNEFWDDGWMQWEPVNTYIGHWYYYANANGDYYRTLDGLDNDCDGVADDETNTADADGDGFSAADGDCNDLDPLCYPGAVELPDGKDQDCDGVADNGFTDPEADVDGDGFSIQGGDCDDTDPERYPGAPERDNRRDDDCDGWADLASEEGDQDGDGWSLADGDCDDTDPDRYPGAVEVGDGVDDDCDGVADNGLDEMDRDGDGYTMAEGDCHDGHAGVHPGAEDPPISNNRLYAITTTRGDAYIGTDRTEDYGTPAWLQVAVTDGGGAPVDGAVVYVFGTWAVYGYPDMLAWATQAVTGLDGVATATVGEANKYFFQVASDLGYYPGAESAAYGPRWTEPFETYEHTAQVEGQMPEPAEVSLVGPPWADRLPIMLEVEIEVERHLITAEGAWEGSFRVEGQGGRVDWLVLDDDQLDRFVSSEPAEAVALARSITSHAESLALPSDRPWNLVLHNSTTMATTMTGVASFSARGPYGELVEFTRSFVIPPGGWWSVLLEP